MRWIGFCLMFTVLAIVPLSVHGQSELGVFVETACFPEITESPLTEDEVTCGYMTVPEIHANPDGQTINLAVVIIDSFSDTPLADPFVMETGGPGSSTIVDFTPLAYMDIGLQIRQEREMIMVEQRGTYYAEPALICDEWVAFNDVSLTLDDADEDGLAVDFLSMVQACVDNWGEEGINLSAYNSVENSHDIAFVMSALGYEQFNFYGGSYGTMLGQHIIRDHGDQLRSAILDGVAPLDGTFLSQYPNAVNDSLRALFETCAQDTACNTDYPDLENVYFDLVDSLNANPVPISIETENGDVEIIFTGDILVEFSRDLMFNYVTITLMPELIYSVSENDDFGWLVVEAIAEIFVNQTSTEAEGMSFAVLCSEEFSVFNPEFNADGLYPDVFRVFSDAISDLPSICNVFDVAALPDYVNDPVVSDVPTLLLNGVYDSATAPTWGALVAEHLSNGYNFVFPALGHGVILGEECPQSVIIAFLNDPNQEPDTTCINDMSMTFEGFASLN